METKLLLFIAIACAVSSVKAGTVNVNVTMQQPNITQNGCGTTKLCFTDCNPVTNASGCFFGSSRLDNNSLVFELSGATTGYVALGLATSQTEGDAIVFVCGNSNATSSPGFIFLTASSTGNSLNLSTSVNTVNSIQGVVVNNQTLNQSYIQCIFSTSTNLTTTRARDSANSYFISIISGLMNGNSPGTFTSLFRSNTKLDLTDPKANVATTTNTPSVSTNAPITVAATTSGSDSLSSPAARALAILLSAIGLLLLY